MLAAELQLGGIETMLPQARLWLLALLLATIRLQAVLVLLPLFARALVPPLLRTAIGAALSLALVPPLQAALQLHQPDGLELASLLAKEALLGLLIGYAVTVLFWAVEGVGFLIDNQRGASIASTLNPLSGNDTSPLGILFNQAFMVYFLVSGGMLVLLKVLYESYTLWPVLSAWPSLPAEGSALFGGLFEQLIRLALLWASPVLVAMLLAELGLALVSRFAPQLQVFFLAMPIKSALAFFVLVIYLPTLFGYLHDEIGRLGGLLNLLAPGLR